MLKGIIPTFRVRDARAAERFYCDVLGFRPVWEDDPRDGHPVFVEVVRDGVAIHLSEHGGDGPEEVSVYVMVTDAQTLWTEITANGASADPPEEMPWGDVVFTLTDPDGNVMRFGSAG